MAWISCDGHSARHLLQEASAVQRLTLTDIHVWGRIQGGMEGVCKGGDIEIYEEICQTHMKSGDDRWGTGDQIVPNSLRIHVRRRGDAERNVQKGRKVFCQANRSWPVYIESIVGKDKLVQGILMSLHHRFLENSVCAVWGEYWANIRNLSVHPEQFEWVERRLGRVTMRWRQYEGLKERSLSILSSQRWAYL